MSVYENSNRLAGHFASTDADKALLHAFYPMHYTQRRACFYRGFRRLAVPRAAVALVTATGYPRLSYDAVRFTHGNVPRYAIA